MSKIIFASDIHGSAFWCEKLLAYADKVSANKLVLLGDLLYHGPRNPLPTGYAPMSVAEMLNARKETLTCVRGNCDAEVDQMVLSFPMRADYAIMEQDGYTFFLTHGHLFSEENLPVVQKGTVLFNGHFHEYKVKALENGVIYANDGSVACPKNGVHTCIVYEDGKLTWIDLETEQAVLEYKLS